MNGVPKYSEMMLFKRMKFIIIAFCSMLIIFAVSHLDSEKPTEAYSVLASAYKVVLEGREIGIVQDKELADEALRSAVNRLQGETSNTILINKRLEFYVEHVEPETFSTLDLLETNIYNTLSQLEGEFKQRAYIIDINENLRIAVESKEAALEILEAAQKRYDQNNDFTVELVEDEYDEQAYVLKVAKLDKVARDTTFTMASTFQEVGEGDEMVVAQAEAGQESNVPEIVDMDFVEPVKVYSQYIASNQVISIEEAIELITKENEKEKVYQVQKGDSLSVIAVNNDMKLDDLLRMNPNLTVKSVLQIGQELVVTVPEPELSVITREKVVYTEKIARTTEYVDNKDKYKGYTSVISNGADGVKEVTALLNKVNGFEDGKEIIQETILTEAIPKVVERGTKPLPSTSATGKYIRPIVGGTLTSPFGYRGREFHHGVDFGIAIGNTVRASDGGTVTFAGWQSSYGYVIYIDHGKGVETRYAHLSKINVKVGQKVAQYEKIGETGNTGRSTGPHIHFEIRFDGVAANPMNYIK